MAEKLHGREKVRRLCSGSVQLPLSGLRFATHADRCPRIGEVEPCLRCVLEALTCPRFASQSGTFSILVPLGKTMFSRETVGFEAGHTLAFLCRRERGRF